MKARERPPVAVAVLTTNPPSASGAGFLGCAWLDLRNREMCADKHLCERIDDVNAARGTLYVSLGRFATILKNLGS